MNSIKKENLVTIFLLIVIVCLAFISISKISLKTHYVTFYVFEEKYAMVEKNKNMEMPNDPIFIGYRFEGWYVDETFETPFNISNTSQVTSVYGKILESYNKVTFDANQGEFIYNFIIVDNNDVIDISMFEKPHKKNHSFLGWYLGEEPFDFKVPITHEITLVAKWELLGYEIRLNPNGGILDEELIWIEKDIMINQLPIPIKDDHIFLGWFEIINGIVSDDIFNFNIMPIKNIDLIAKWEHMAVLSFQNAELLELGFDELILDIGTNIDIFMLNMVHAYNNDLEFHGISFVYKKGIEITGYTLINPGNSSYFTEDGAIVILKISVYDKNFEYEIKDGEIYIVGYKGTSRDLVLPSSYRGLNVVGIENSALSNKNLRQVVFSPYIRYIGDKAFLNNGLFLVEIINLLDLEYIGQSAFENNYITDVVLKDLPSLSRIDKRSFAFNTILNITLDDLPNIHNIDQDAFLGNNRISRINILGKTQKIVENNSYWWPNRHKIFSTSSDLIYYGVEILNAAMFCSEIINWFDKLDIKYLSKDI